MVKFRAHKFGRCISQAVEVRRKGRALEPCRIQRTIIEGHGGNAAFCRNFLGGGKGEGGGLMATSLLRKIEIRHTAGRNNPSGNNEREPHR